MKHKIYSLVAMLTMALALTSCFKEEEKVPDNSSQATAIVAFSIKEVKILHDTVNAAGKDTVVVTKYKPTTYRFYINQNNGTIYNPDSLPYGTRAKAVLTKITAKSNGKIFIRPLTIGAATPYKENDSIDFSQPRIIEVYSQNGEYRKTYTITVNVHKQRGNEFKWNTLNDNTNFALFDDVKMVSYNKKMYVFGKKGSQTICYFTAENDGNTWTQVPTTFGATSYKSVIATENGMFLLDNGQIKHSNDGVTWTTVSTAPLQQLVAAGATELYALSNSNTLMVSKDNGVSWTNEALDANSSYLPTNGIGFIYQPSATDNQISRVTLFGTNTTNNFVVAWTKLIDGTSTSTSYKWSFVETEVSSEFQLPKYNHLSVIYYNNKAMAFGVTDNGKFAPIKESINNGIVWTTNKHYVYPTETPSRNFAIAADSQKYIWIICGNKVWKGRLNSEGWSKQQTEFTRSY